MSDKANNLEDLQNKLQVEKQIEVGSSKILFLDISSSCTGYVVAAIDFKEKKVDFRRAGAIWLDPKWSHQQKYNYMFNALSNYFWVVEGIDYIVVEQYTINSKKMMGVQVVPEMQGAIKAGAWENGVIVDSILPQSWRSTLGIKKNDKKDYKAPTKEKILEYVAVPEQSVSNITKVERKTPSDVYDAFGVAIGWLIRLGLEEDKMDFSNMRFNTHVGHQFVV
jgi:Holliday junction resolvasome RuvABC endonuclease subunit